MYQSLQLERLAIYHDSDSFPWNLDKRWEDLTPKEWTEVCHSLYHLMFSYLGAFCTEEKKS